VADRHFVVEHGQVVDMFTNDQIESNRAKLEEYLGV
jgi:branched-chain amino acid transport system ATP-binding protein